MSTFTETDLLAIYHELRPFAHRLTRNVTDAEDLLHDMIVKILRRDGTFKPGSNFPSWATQILLNTFRTRWKARKRHGELNEQYLSLQPVSIEGSQVPATELDMVANAFAKLRPDLREVLYAICVEERDYDDAAKQLDLPIGTVKSRVSRGRARLRDACLGW